MPTIPRSQNHLAELLGIAKSICSRHKARGMPTDTLENARAWMNATLDPARRKGSRFDQYYQAPASRQRQPPKPTTSLVVTQVSTLMDAASALLEAGQPITALVPSLRAALRAVPHQERGAVGLYLDVTKVLVADVLALWPADRNAKCEDGSPVYLDRDMTDAEAQEMGEFWYAAAAGEWVVPDAALV
jgi:hypothetical protein